jgi:hypothetical protein
MNDDLNTFDGLYNYFMILLYKYVQWNKDNPTILLLNNDNIKVLEQHKFNRINNAKPLSIKLLDVNLDIVVTDKVDKPKIC